MEYQQVYDLVRNINDKINVYRNDDKIIVDGLVKKEGIIRSMYKLTDLKSPQWNTFPSTMKISFKNLLVVLNDKENESFIQEIINLFGRDSIIDCELIRLKYYKSENDEKIYRKATWCGYGCGYLPQIKF